MVCEMCQQKVATVHLTVNRMATDEAAATSSEHHFCPECADRYFAQTPGMNASRGLIELSDEYRSKLLDELEQKHPTVFTWWRERGDVKRNITLMREFLMPRLQVDRIDVAGDAFEMLFQDLTGSDEFNERRTKRSGPDD
jgi:hypothetical protein